MNLNTTTKNDGIKQFLNADAKEEEFGWRDLFSPQSIPGNFSFFISQILPPLLSSSGAPGLILQN